MSQEKPSFVITQGRIAFVLSLITLLGVFYQGAKFVLDAQYRIVALEEKWTAIEQSQRDLTQEIGRLSVTLNELNITLREVQVRQEKDNE